MPYTPPHYRTPTFTPTGNAEVDASLSEWANQFGQQHQETQEAASRLPFIVSTFSNHTTSVGGAYMSAKVQLMGGEQVVVSGHFDFSVGVDANSTAGTGTTNQQAVGKLRVRFPGGSETTFDNQPARLRVQLGAIAAEQTSVKTSVAIRATVSFNWPVNAKFQTGGDHMFTLATSGAGTVNAGTLSILVV